MVRIYLVKMNARPSRLRPYRLRIHVLGLGLQLRYRRRADCRSQLRRFRLECHNESIGEASAHTWTTIGSAHAMRLALRGQACLHRNAEAFHGVLETT